MERDLAAMVWFFSGWATGIITAAVGYCGLRYLHKRLFVWPHHPKYKDPKEPNL